jgi:hypothetical protein
MTTSPSEFTAGQWVWEAFAYINSQDQPAWRIRRAQVVSAGGEGRSTLLRYDDGRADIFWPTKSLQAFTHHVEAVAHCVGVFAAVRRDIEEAIDTLMAMNDDHPAGPGRSGITTAGTAPPEVAK